MKLKTMRDYEADAAELGVPTEQLLEWTKCDRCTKKCPVMESMNSMLVEQGLGPLDLEAKRKENRQKALALKALSGLIDGREDS